MHPYMIERLAEAHRDDLRRRADRARVPVRARSRRQSERVVTRLLDALADRTRPRGISRCPADA